MAEPLIQSSHVVGEWDPAAGGWSALDWVPGPAGTAGLTLRGGVELEIDVAAPGTFVGLWVPGRVRNGRARPSRDGTRVLATLLGDDRAAELVALATGDGRPRQLRGRPSRLKDVGYAFDPPGTARRPEFRGVSPQLGRTALALAVASRPEASGLVRALGHLDAAAAAASIGPGLGLGALARVEAAAGAELLLELTRRGELRGAVDPAALLGVLRDTDALVPEPLQGGLRAIAADVASERIRFLPPLKPDVASRAERREDTLAAPPMPAAAAGPPPQRRRAVAPLLAVDHRSLPHTFATGQVVARATTRSEAEVRIAERGVSAPGWWARAFDADGVILAAAPFRQVGYDAVARLLVPPDQLRRVEIDLTDRPGDPRASARARAVTDAIAAGQAAARAERLGDDVAAGRRWSECASHWGRAGDPARSSNAYAMTGEMSPWRERDRVPPPLTADAIAEEDA